MKKFNSGFVNPRNVSLKQIQELADNQLLDPTLGDEIEKLNDHLEVKPKFLNKDLGLSQLKSNFKPQLSNMPTSTIKACQDAVKNEVPKIGNIICYWIDFSSQSYRYQTTTR